MAMGKKTSTVLLILLIILGLYLRISGTLNGVFAFTFDQGKDFLTLRDLIYNHKLQLIGATSGIDGVFHGVWWYWFMAPLFWLTGGNPQLVVLSFNIFSALIIPLVFILGKRIVDTRLGLILAGMTAVSRFVLGTATQFWHPNIEPVLVVLFLLAIYRYFKKGTGFGWVGLASGAIFEFQLLFGGLFTAAFLVTAMVMRLTPQKKDWLRFGLGFSLWLIPRIIFDLRHGFLQLKSFFNYVWNPAQSRWDVPLILRIFDRLHTTFVLLNDTYGRGYSIITAVIMVITVAATAYFTFKSHDPVLKKLVIFITLIILGIVGGASIYTKAVWNYYLIGLPFLSLPFAGFGFQMLMRRLRYLGVILFIGWLMWLWEPWSGLSGPWEGDASVYINQLRVVDTVLDDIKDSPFNVQVYTPAVIDYAYDYLFLWRGETRDGHVPDRKGSQKLVYLIIEPEIWNPKIKEAWLRDREGDGTIVWHKKFPGGIEVEKRVR